ncbi:MAG: CAP domain-containing protein [Chloroflexi bacterium]|nr:MAG: CAP domain-containing protein [Chloroflexota bacterium]
MVQPRRLLPRLLAGFAITIAGAQVALAHPARPELASAAVLPIHPPLHHVIDATPTPAPPPAPARPAPGVGVARSSVGGSSGSAPSRRAPVAAMAQQALINADRAAAGLPPLAWSPCLAAVAAQNAARMAAQGFISHANGPSLDLACHVGLSAGENVGYTSAGADDGQLNQLFMNSPEHRANILGAYHFVGAAWAIAPSGYGYVAVEFG